MKKIFFTQLAVVFIVANTFAQSNFYDVYPVEGNGLRFWASDYYKVHMGNSTEYHFGPVTDYSIKMNMSSNTGEAGGKYNQRSSDKNYSDDFLKWYYDEEEDED